MRSTRKVEILKAWALGSEGGGKDNDGQEARLTSAMLEVWSGERLCWLVFVEVRNIEG
jgi:hypothetical protein